MHHWLVFQALQTQWYAGHCLVQWTVTSTIHHHAHCRSIDKAQGDPWNSPLPICFQNHLNVMYSPLKSIFTLLFWFFYSPHIVNVWFLIISLRDNVKAFLNYWMSKAFMLKHVFFCINLRAFSLQASWVDFLVRNGWALFCNLICLKAIFMSCHLLLSQYQIFFFHEIFFLPRLWKEMSSLKYLILWSFL